MNKTVLYVVLALVALWFITQETNKLERKATQLTGDAAQKAGYGFGQGIVSSGTAAIGSFLGSLFHGGGSSSSTSSGSFGGSSDYVSTSYDDSHLDANAVGVAFHDVDNYDFGG